MTQDPFITRMMAETFESEDAVARVSSSHPEQDFRLRRGLAKLPVMAFEGTWVATAFAQFHIHNHTLDLPLGHSPLHGWSSSRGEVLQHHAFLQACGSIVNMKFTHLFVMQSEDDKPWLIFWNEEEERVDVEQLRSLFISSEEFKKAA
jgi:hypothetical protein